MSRKQRNIGIYTVLVLGIPGLAVWAVLAAGGGSRGLILLAVAFFLVARIAAFLLRPLIASRRHLDAERFDQGEEAATAAIALFRKQPWRQRCLFLLWSVYTWDALAMAYNNRGVARMLRGALDEAVADLRIATQLDEGYALPLFNLSAIASVMGDEDGAERLLRKAAERGYKGDPIDRLVQQVATAYARLEPTARRPFHSQ